MSFFSSTDNDLRRSKKLRAQNTRLYEKDMNIGDAFLRESSRHC